MADHAIATIDNPSSALTDFTLAVDLSNLPATWWSTIDTSDGTKGRVYKGDGSTRLACDWIDFDSSAETGILRVLWSGSLSSSGTQELWIEPPATALTAVTAADTYGQHAAYNSAWKAYWPMNGAEDRTSNGNDLTAVGGVTFGNATGKLGDATNFEQDNNESATGGTSSSLELGNHTLLSWINPESFSGAGRKILFAKSDTILENGYEFGFTQDDGYPSFAYNNGDIRGWYAGPTAFSTGSFQHVAYDVSYSAGTIIFYKNTSAATAVSINATSPTYSADTATIAWQSNNPNEFDGIINELQLHSTIRGQDWISEEYAQTNDNANFYTTWTWAASSATSESCIGSGTLAFSGVGLSSVVISCVGSGTLSFSGSASTSVVESYIGSGTLSFSGSADVAESNSCVGSGTLAFSGAATTSVIESYTGSGTLAFSGAALANVVISCIGAGTLAFSGAATASYNADKTYVGDGTLSFSGSASTSVIESYTGSGTLSLSGDALVSVIESYTGTGTISFSGDADASYSSGHDFVGSGTFAFSGVADITGTMGYDGSGTFTWSGSAAAAIVGSTTATVISTINEGYKQTPGILDITVVQGDDINIQFTQAINFSGYTFVSSVHELNGGDTLLPLAMVTSASSSTIQVDFSSTITGSLAVTTNKGAHNWKCVYADTLGKTRTLVKGDVKVLSKV